LTATRVRSVESPHFHLWTDALHARELARQAQNRWDKGTYVRWAIITAWTVLEMTCDEALSTTGIGRRFRANLDEALSAGNLEPVDWGRGLWQQVAHLHELRKEYVHRNLSQKRLFAPVEEAENAISVVRAAINDLYRRARKPAPAWIEVDDDPGWDSGSGGGLHAMIMRAGADPEAPDSVKIAYVHKDREYVTEVLPGGSDPAPVVERLIACIRIPISAIRVYVGRELVDEVRLLMRGAD